jgi:hypothetical protein
MYRMLQGKLRTLVYKFAKQERGVTTVLFLLFLFLSTTLVFFSISNSIYIYFLVTGFILAYYILNETKYCTVSFLFLSAPFWSVSALISLAGLFALLSIPLGLWLILLLSIVLCLLILVFPPEGKKIKTHVNIYDFSLLVFWILALISRVLSVADFIVPILHDPISHSTWAKEIYDTGLINYFYSPGLHVISALGMMADGVTVSKYVLLLTNIFNALCFVPVYLFIENYFKNKKFAILSSVLFITALFPAKFFWGAGKNALVVAIPLIFLALFISSLKFNKVKKFLLLNLLVFTLVLVHYPSALIGIVGIFFVAIEKDRLKGLINFLPGTFLGFVWGVVKTREQMLRKAVSASLSSEGPLLGVQDILSFAKGIYSQVQGFFNFPLGSLLFAFGILGLGIMVLLSFRKRRYLYFSLILFSSIALMYIIEFVPRLGFLHIVYSTQILTFFIFIYIGAAFLFSKIILPYLLRHIKFINILFFVLIFIVTSFSTFQIYSKYRDEQESLNMVQGADFKVFNWMHDNLEAEGIILNNARRGGREYIIFASDGGGWIPVFTDFEIAMPFTEFSSKNTHENYAIYERFFDSEYSCEEIEELLEKGIKYYYKGSRNIFGDPFVPDGENENFESLYSFKGAEIFLVHPCD